MRNTLTPGSTTTASVVGFSVSTADCQTSVAIAWKWLKEGNTAHYMACANPHALEVARTDADFAAALHDADILVPDGVGVLLAGRILGGRFAERVAGMDFFTAINQRANEEGGLSCFFLGSSEKTLAMIREQMALEYPKVRVVGTYSPPFKATFDEADNAAMVEAINAAAPDILWVGMTAPKQEKWIHQNRHRLQVKVIGAVGAVFDFFAGTKPRSPEWMRRHGLEWLARLSHEPGRMWRRTVISLPRFVCTVLRHRLDDKR